MRYQIFVSWNQTCKILSRNQILIWKCLDHLSGKNVQFKGFKVNIIVYFYLNLYKFNPHFQKMLTNLSLYLWFQKNVRIFFQKCPGTRFPGSWLFACLQEIWCLVLFCLYFASLMLYRNGFEPETCQRKSPWKWDVSQPSKIFIAREIMNKSGRYQISRY